MRRNLTFLLGTATGVCLTLLVAGPQGAHLVAAAKAAARSDTTYAQLNLFGEVFERVRADYVEKPSDAALMEGAINGMVTSLDPQIEKAHLRAVQERRAEYQAGRSVPVDGDEALKHIRAAIRR